ncbi:hypothetical protein KSP40_PGU017587 [Platanthera guangdongensis]|uniref:Uncharacterized protein n=1 Tax=Platanthera guangdongensis TaxID=2320717 RepID=A0ABR2LE34_9ASPA
MPPTRDRELPVTSWSREGSRGPDSQAGGDPKLISVDCRLSESRTGAPTPITEAPVRVRPYGYRVRYVPGVSVEYRVRTGTGYVSGFRIKTLFVAVAESTPLLNVLSLSSAADVGVLIVDPRGGKYLILAQVSKQFHEFFHHCKTVDSCTTTAHHCFLHRHSLVPLPPTLISLSIGSVPFDDFTEIVTHELIAKSCDAVTMLRWSCGATVGWRDRAAVTRHKCEREEAEREMGICG